MVSVSPLRHAGFPLVRELTGALLATLLFSTVIAVVVTQSPSPASGAVGNPELTLGHVPGPSGNDVETGTAIFDGQGQCSGGAPAAPPVPHPGNDCSAGDNVVRTNDFVSYGYSIGVSNLLGPGDPGGPEHVDDVYYTQTITPDSPAAIIEFANLPPACQTGNNPDTGNPYDPQSQLIALSGGAWQLVCNIGRLSGPSQTVFMQTQVKVDSSSKNNSSFTSTDSFCEGAPEDPPGTPAGGCTPVSDRSDVDGVDAAEITPDHQTYISAAPQFDLAKNKYGPNNSGVVTHPVTGELGYRYRFYPTIEVDAAADGKGSSPLDGDITFEDMLYVQGTTTPVPGFEMNPTGADCYWNNHSGRPIPFGKTPYGSDPERNVTDTGTVGCTQAAAGAPIEITLTGTDTSGNHFPSLGSNGATALEPPYYVAVMYQYVWVPFVVIDRYDPAAVCDAADTSAGYAAPFCGEIDDTGDLPLTNCLEAFDPDAIDADGNPVSNYGDGVEPGVYGAGDGNNNCRNTSMRLTNAGSASKYYHKKVVDGGWVGGVPTGQTGYHTGDGPLEPNQYIAAASRFYNSGSFPFTNAVLCENIDNMTQTLVPIQTAAGWVPTDSSGNTLPVEVHMTGGTYDPNLLVVEYASGPAGTPATGSVQWDNDHLVGGTNPLTGLYDQSTSAAQETTDCSDANGNWTTDPFSFDSAQQASLQKIRAVRVSYLGTMEPGMDIRMGIELQMLNTFNGGPHAGQLIPAGVILPNHVHFRVDQLNGGDWRNSYYDQNADTGWMGDRMISSRGYVRLAKHVVPYNTHHSAVNPADYAPVDSGTAGDPFQFRLLPAVRSNVTSGAPLTDVTVTDVLPSWLTYDPVCTAAVSAWPPPVVQNNTPNPGETTLIWNLGTVVPNGTLNPIDFCVDTSTQAPDGTNAVNTAVISANEDVSPVGQREATATVILNQIGGFRVEKVVDSPLDPQDNNQVFTLQWLNSSDFVTLDAPIVIDVFAHLQDEVGEGSNAPRSPGSDFNGTTWLSAPATATTGGTFLYTKRDEYVVHRNPTDASNPFSTAPYDTSNPNVGPLPDSDDDGESDSGTTIWCEVADFGTPGCPATLAEATGLMFVGSDEIPPGGAANIEFTMDTLGNLPGDVYANNFAGFTPSLPGQLSFSNTVTVRIAGLSLGDLVWFDYNDNGIYEPALGELPVPDGVTIELLDGSLAPLGPTTTTVNGRYVFDSLDPGTYAVRIPAAEFAVGAPLETMRPSTPVGVPDDDVNEDTDQHGIAAGGGVVTGTVFLSWTQIGPDSNGNIDIAGDEPVGDDVAALRVVLDDALHNMTLDIGLLGDPGLELVKKINGDDANTLPGVLVVPGDPLTWTYEVENTGDVVLTNVTITDDQGVTVVCPAHNGDSGGDNIIDLLGVGESLICTGTGVATADGYTNIGTATGTPPSGTEIEVEDPANYFGATPAIEIEKATNTVDADNPNGPLIDESGTVTWTYEVENTGNTALVDVAVTDSVVAAADISCANHLGDSNGDNVIALLLPGESVTCTATGSAIGGQYANTGSVNGDPVFPESPSPGYDPGDPDTYPTTPSDYIDSGLDDVVDTDDSHYYGTDPSLALEKTTNTVDADAPTGPFVAQGDPITWTYTVENNGNIPLLNVAITDNIVAAADISCATHMADADGNNTIDIMLPGNIVECTATGIATAGQYANLGEAVGDPVFPTAPGDYDPDDPSSWPTDPGDYTDTGDDDPEAEDPSHYYGTNPGLTLEKATNGVDADNPTGPAIEVGDPVTWTYEIENTGNTALLAIAVTDNIVAAADISCDNHMLDTNSDNNVDVLLPGDIVECTATGIATSGQYANTGDVTGAPSYPSNPPPGFDPDDPTTWPENPTDYGPTGDDPADDTDDSHYLGATPGLTLEKDTNGDDADVPTGPYVAENGAVTWTYVLENTGDTALTDVVVGDDQLPASAISCETHRGDSDLDNTIGLMLPGDIVTCTATGTATVGQYTNTADATGDPTMPDPATCGCDLADPATWTSDDPDAYDPLSGATAPEAEDPSHYYGADPSLTLEKATNGADADVPIGPDVPIGSTITWTYTIENTGNTPLVGVAVTDNIVPASDISCAAHRLDSDGNNTIDVLIPGDIVICTATGVAIAGQYANTGTAEGQPAFPSNPGPDFDPEDPATYPNDPTSYDDITDPTTGNPLPPEQGDDPSHYFGADVVLELEKSTNGADADTPTGPWILDGETVTWTYEITNSSNTALTDVTLSDDQVAAADISCESHQLDTNGDNVIDLLLPGAIVECSASAPASAIGQYQNNSTITGQPVFPTNPGTDFDPSDPDTWPEDPTDYAPVVDPDTGEDVPPVEDEDPSHYWGATSSIALEKLVNGVDEDTAPGAQLDNGDPVTWTFVVTNDGTVPQTNIVVSDDDASVSVDCGDGTNTIGLLLPTEVAECEATATVEAGEYVNVGSVSGQPSFPDTDDPDFDPANPDSYPPIIDPDTGQPTSPDTASDPSHHFGNGPALELVKEVCVLDDGSACDPANDDHWANEALHHPSATETWRITVENTGNVVLSDVEVTDPAIPACDLTIGTMAIGDRVVHTCEGDPGTAPSTNTAAVTGSGPSGKEVSSEDSASLAPPPELKVEKVVADDTLQNGATATFTLTVTNVGSGIATMTELVDVLPSELTFVGVTTPNATTSYDTASRTLTWEIGTLAPGASTTLTYTATVKMTSGSITNTASVSSGELEAPATLSDNSDTASITVSPPPPSIALTGANSRGLVVVSLVLLWLGLMLVTGTRAFHRRSATVPVASRGSKPKQ